VSISWSSKINKMLIPVHFFIVSLSCLFIRIPGIGYRDATSPISLMLA